MLNINSELNKLTTKASVATATVRFCTISTKKAINNGIVTNQNCVLRKVNIKMKIEGSSDAQPDGLLIAPRSHARKGRIIAMMPKMDTFFEDISSGWGLEYRFEGKTFLAVFLSLSRCDCCFASRSSSFSSQLILC